MAPAGRDKMIFLSHTGRQAEQKDFIRDLDRILHHIGCYTFFDESHENLPFGERYAKRIWEAVNECKLGVVLLSQEFLQQRWPMMELIKLTTRAREDHSFRVLPLFYDVQPQELYNLDQYHSCWAGYNLNVNDCVTAVREIRDFNGVVRSPGEPRQGYTERCKEAIVARDNHVAPDWLEDMQ